MLNNNAEADPVWLGEPVAALEANPELGFCASKMVLQRDRDLADVCGDFYMVEGIPGKIGHLEPAHRYNESREVFGARAGAAIYHLSGEGLDHPPKYPSCLPGKHHPGLVLARLFSIHGDRRS